MLDVHVVTSGGSTGGLGTIGTIALGGDGASIAGVPIRANAILRYWAILSTIADTIERARLQSSDMPAENNPEDYNIGAGSLVGLFGVETNLPYGGGQRNLAIDQNTAGANAMGVTLDKYGEGMFQVGDRYDRAIGQRVVVRDTMAAVTAITWQSLAFVPDSTIALPAGIYAILGAWVQDITNYAVIRFQHADFGGLNPGFPVIDSLATATARAVVVPQPLLFDASGFQFVYLQDVPTFSAGPQGTGLTVQIIDIVADTPVVILNLAKVG